MSEPEKQVSPSDDIRGDIEKAFEAADQAETEGYEKVIADAVTPKSQDEPKPAAAISPPVKEGQSAADEAKVAGDQPSAAGERRPADKGEALAPPIEWQGKAKINWGRLPRDVQSAIVADYNRLSEAQDRYGDLEKVLAPRANTIAAEFGSPAIYVQRMLQLSDFAERDPAGFISWFAKNRGLDLGKLTAPPASAQQQQQAAADPGSALAQRLAQLEQVTLAQAQAMQQNQYQSLATQTQRFFADPARPYANDLRITMADLLDSGQAKTLEEAYDKAMWLNPETREALLNERLEAEKKSKAATVERARNAGRSITGAPTNAVNGHSSDDVLGAIESAWAAHEGRL